MLSYKFKFQIVGQRTWNYNTVSEIVREAYVAGETEGTVYSMDPPKTKRRKREHDLEKHVKI